MRWRWRVLTTLLMAAVAASARGQDADPRRDHQDRGYAEMLDTRAATAPIDVRSGLTVHSQAFACRRFIAA